MPLLRHWDWRERLERMVESARHVPFQWGTFDCALHAANCIRAITANNYDFAAGFRGTYSTEAGAAAIYGSSLLTFVSTLLSAQGCTEVPTTLARRGDVVWINNGTSQGAIGIVCSDGRFASCVTDSGLLLVRRRYWSSAWWVG